jgi:hypothetical protein
LLFIVNKIGFLISFIAICWFLKKFMGKHISTYKQIIFCTVSLLLILTSCKTEPLENKFSDIPITQSGNTPTQSRTMAVLLTETPLPPSPTERSVTSTVDPFSKLTCSRPSDNYEILELNGHQLNQRTYEMLQRAKRIYGGIIDITGDAITQGSYTSAVEASFGTHAGGGAVDLSVMSPGTYRILYDDIDPLIKALRLVGFAAWYRDLDELYDGSPAHIHAIAIGDHTLSLAAREQLAGPFGYFWGYNGLPQENKVPIRDPHGGPILCDWMIEKGYPNKTATPSADSNPP